MPDTKDTKEKRGTVRSIEPFADNIFKFRVTVEFPDHSEVAVDIPTPISKRVRVDCQVTVEYRLRRVLWFFSRWEPVRVY